jgi:hypothetical protein
LIAAICCGFTSRRGTDQQFTIQHCLSAQGCGDIGKSGRNIIAGA